MADPMRIRAQAQGDKAVVRVLMSHEMETGQRKDAQGRAIPAWHISEFTLSLNGAVVFSGQLGTGVSKDPFLELVLRGVKVGDQLKLDWTDTRGDKRSDSAAILAA